MRHKHGKFESIAYRHVKTNKSPLITVSLRLGKDKVEYLKSKNIELSSLVRELLDEEITKMKAS